MFATFFITRPMHKCHAMPLNTHMCRTVYIDRVRDSLCDLVAESLWRYPSQPDEEGLLEEKGFSLKPGAVRAVSWYLSTEVHISQGAKRHGWQKQFPVGLLQSSRSATQWVLVAGQCLSEANWAVSGARWSVSGAGQSAFWTDIGSLKQDRQSPKPNIRSQGPVGRSLRLDSQSLRPDGQSLSPENRFQEPYGRCLGLDSQPLDQTVSMWRWNVGYLAGQSRYKLDSRSLGSGGQLLVRDSRPLKQTSSLQCWTVGLCDRMIGLWGQMVSLQGMTFGLKGRSVGLWGWTVSS